MKVALSLALLGLWSLPSFTQEPGAKCDLSANDEQVQEINDRFDRGEMRGEDHVIALKFSYEQRLGMIAECVIGNRINGVKRAELLDTLEDQESQLKIYLEEINDSIRISVENDRIGMATQLMMERDLHVAEVRTLQDKIRTILKKME